MFSPHLSHHSKQLEKSNKCVDIRLNMEQLNDVARANSKPRRRSKRRVNTATPSSPEPEENVEVVTFLPNVGEGELKDIPGFGQVLETRSLEDGKVIRYPISALG